MTVSPDAYWLALRRVRGVGPRTCRLLLERFGSPHEVFAADEQAITATGIPRPTAQNIKEFKEFDPVEKELCELPRLGARLVRWSDADYPPNLRHIADPPPFLFLRGALAPELKYIAVVGARAASDAGRRMAQRLGLELAAKGFTVVSGLARGIDSEAHQGALDGGGLTVAVMGCGIDIIYPPENRKLADNIIAGGGGLISELPIGTPPVAENFPARNRLISGLCLGVIIVEAAERSGSLITARMALEQDRQVFAVPGSPLTGKTRGSNRLLREGARLVECVEDVVEELAPQLVEAGASADINGNAAKRGEQLDGREREAQADSEPNEAKLLIKQLKASDKLHIDALIENSGLTPQTVLKLLLELELKGLVTQHPGKLFSLVRPAS